MSVRAGIVVTGTEVLTGRVVDRNGPWLADRLRELGIDLAHNVIVGDRPEDVRAALGWLASSGAGLIVTSGGLGPTEDDLTAQVVGEFQGRAMVLDEALEGRIAAILERLSARWPGLDQESIRHSNRKQALVPEGAAILEPVGTAPGLVVPSVGDGGPVVVVLPGPPRELQPMWTTAVATPLFQAAIAGATEYRQRMLRLFGIPESEIAATLRVARDGGVDIDRLEITTCLRRGEVEIVTRYEPAHDELYDAFEAVVRQRHADTLFSDDGASVDQQVAMFLRDSGRTLAVAESCTGGLLAARVTELPGSGDYFAGGIVAYANEAKLELVGVDADVLERYGAVSSEVAVQLAQGAMERFGAGAGVGITGIAGPGGGSKDKPVGTICVAVALRGGEPVGRRVHLPGGRADVRDRTTTLAMHMLRRVLAASAPA